MGRGYMPRADAAALGWLRNFADVLGADPARYAVGPGAAATVREVVDRFEEAMRRATTPGTRSAEAVAAKDRTRGVAAATCSLIYHQVKANRGIPDADKVVLGVWPRGPGGAGRPVEAPTTAPVLGVVMMTRGRQTLTYRDAMNPGRVAKPAGVALLEVWRALADRPVRDVGAARLVGAATRTPFVVACDHGDDGKVATYFGRWQTARGRVGPWSQGVSVRVAG